MVYFSPTSSSTQGCVAKRKRGSIDTSRNYIMDVCCGNCLLIGRSVVFMANIVWYEWCVQGFTVTYVIFVSYFLVISFFKVINYMCWVVGYDEGWPLQMVLAITAACQWTLWLLLLTDDIISVFMRNEFLSFQLHSASVNRKQRVLEALYRSPPEEHLTFDRASFQEHQVRDQRSIECRVQQKCQQYVYSSHLFIYTI